MLLPNSTKTANPERKAQTNQHTSLTPRAIALKSSFGVSRKSKKANLCLRGQPIFSIPRKCSCIAKMVKYPGEELNEYHSKNNLRGITLGIIPI